MEARDGCWRCLAWRGAERSAERAGGRGGPWPLPEVRDRGRGCAWGPLCDVVVLQPYNALSYSGAVVEESLIGPVALLGPMAETGEEEARTKTGCRGEASPGAFGVCSCSHLASGEESPAYLGGPPGPLS
ncbi:hypothetical protein NDU88_004283 [Pleurodeles waltl]|uniref:Uncharacterized protein n=1 Tax=Pleurodeles waltl TaxID=8319 RepID=A0AAV7MW07_PLEWA|nr:hypothetical protein NDU88_004283 [Pleurodeles waltl]